MGPVVDPHGGRLKAHKCISSGTGMEASTADAAGHGRPRPAPIRHAIAHLMFF